MSLFMQLCIGTGMIGVTVAFQAIAMDFIMKHAGRIEAAIKAITDGFWQPFMASIIVLCVFLVQIINIWLWTLLYLGSQCAPLDNLPDALYFSTITYTTVGYGDIILTRSCHMLSGVEATNGFILFGWAAAFIFEVISRIYKREARSF